MRTGNSPAEFVIDSGGIGWVFEFVPWEP